MEASPGYYTDINASTSQIPCPTGKYNPVSGANSSAMCLDADPGNFSDILGASSQSPCPIGEYQPYSGKNHACRPIQETLSNHQGKIAKKNVSQGVSALFRPAKLYRC